MTILEERPLADPFQLPDEDRQAPAFELTDEECYLVAILLDESGLDLAEFCWVDETQEHGCYRAYPYQWPWWRDPAPRQIDQCGRSLGKSEGIMARILAFPYSFPGGEQAFVAPQKKHIENLSKRVEMRIRASRLLSYFVQGGPDRGIKHQPFDILWANGAYLQSRLPQATGLGLKGLHPIRLEVDEGQDITDAAYKELPEVVRWEVDNARWMIHGVSKGVQDTFWAYTQPDSGFKVHRLTGMHRPDWTEEKKQQRIKEYGGSKDTADYIRNVLGDHAYAADRIVNLHRLMLCVDTEASRYNTEEYAFFELRPEPILDEVRKRKGGRRAAPGIEESTEDQAQVIRDLLLFPQLHRNYKTFWCGMDVGLVNDPTELLVFAEYEPTQAEIRADINNMIAVPLEGKTRLKLLTRIHIRQLPSPLLEEVVMHVIDFYKPKAFSFDSTGIGLPLWQGLQKRAGRSKLAVLDYANPEASAARLAEAEQERAERALTAIKGYNFSGKLVVEFDAAKLAELKNPTPEDMVEKAGIKRIVKDFGTDLVREVVDEQRLKLPDDGDITNSINGQTVTYGEEAIDPYGRRRYNYAGGKAHILDALRMALVGRHMTPIDVILAPKKKKPILDRFGG